MENRTEANNSGEMNGVGGSPANMTQSMMATPSPSLVEDKATPDLMTASMNSLSSTPSKSGKRPLSHRNQASQNWFLFDTSDENEGRTDVAAAAKEREERVRRLRETQEEERKRKLEELKQHALNSQKFREQQENERRKHIEELRSKDYDRRHQVEERRKEIEKAENERREALLLRNKEREERITTQRKNSRSHIDFAFGSSAPRLLEPRVDSGYWGSRSPGERNSAEREMDLKNKRTVSAQGLDRSTEGDDDGLVGFSSSGAHRRRTDLIPTILMSRSESRSATPSKMRSPGISRENTSSRPGSAMSGSSGPPRGAVRLRSAPSRRPRPTSIATTGMTASMYEERQRPAHVPRQKLSGTPMADRLKRARSVTSDAEDDARSTTSSVGPATRTPARKTPAQVKAEAAARKAKATKPAPSTPKGNLGKKDAVPNTKSPSPTLSTENMDKVEDNMDNQRQITPDIIKDNNKEKKDIINKEEKDNSSEVEGENGVENKEKNIITSEEQAKARIAQKRKEMKEKKEREEELERQRQAELERLEEERRLKEEEEERKMMEEADRLAAEARRAEEERVQRAIEEAENEKQRQEEEEEKLKREKEEFEKKAKEEAEKREIELQEKLKKEEEERLARKKRIEEIMARTRGKSSTPNTTPKKEVESQPSQGELSPPLQPTSLKTNVDPTKPDLLGDLNDSVTVAAENAKNIEVSGSSDSSVSQNGVGEVVKNGEGEVEKGAIDSLSKADLASDEFITNTKIHSSDFENSKPRSPSPLIDVEDSTKRAGSAVTEASQFDQLIDLGAMSDTNKAEQPDHAPIIAFEDSITSPRQQQNSAELLS